MMNFRVEEFLKVCAFCKTNNSKIIIKDIFLIFLSLSSRDQGYRDRTSDQKLGFAWFWKGRCNYYFFGIKQQLLPQYIIRYWFLSNKLQDLLAQSAPTNQQLGPMAALFKKWRNSSICCIQQHLMYQSFGMVIVP